MADEEIINSQWLQDRLIEAHEAWCCGQLAETSDGQHGRHPQAEHFAAHVASTGVAALREAVNAGPDDIVCLLPDGTLSVAERPDYFACSGVNAITGFRCQRVVSFDGDLCMDHGASFSRTFRIPGAKP